ncbi:hypothetical protein TD95_002616 [Thielaviopsis punctulata]|uniref:Peroxin 26 n=1 Tax=Thielaviopsis punctulata TaxID=72032 RepID=A0A0F4ZJX0_9PEZI|nr:hypothetical protein TD95_002616 [Thielaviopsis punctulata]
MSFDSSFSAATMSPGHDGGFAASITPLSNARGSRRTSHISKSYRQASTLFLTRRLPEALSTIVPLVSPKSAHANGIAIDPAPVVKASKSSRIKVWSLYLTILNAIVELEPQDGKEMIGAQEFRTICTKVREGDIWEEVVQNGYQGMEADVDAEVVINLATLLLAHAGSQTVNQRRLEAYLTGFNSPMSLARKLDDVSQSPDLRQIPRSPVKGGGTDTPRDLNARIKILELYTLHVLLRNNEWETSKAYISASPFLDEERREAFLQALQSLREEEFESKRRYEQEAKMREQAMRDEIEEAKRQRDLIESRERQRIQEERRREAEAASVASSNRSSTTKGSASGRMGGPGNSYNAPPTNNRLSPASAASAGNKADKSGKKPVAKSPSPISITGRASLVMAQLKGVIDSLSRSLNINVAILLQLLAFVIGMLLMLGRRDVREKVQQIVAAGWTKVKETVSMGARVSSI